MDKSSIMDTYAIKQWYESWDNLVNEKINEQRLSLYYDFNAVTDLIQEELKKKIHNELNGVHFYNRTYFEHCRKEILNTEILW